MRITYLDNSGFALFLKEAVLLIDYYNMDGQTFSQGVADPLILAGYPRVYVLASHRHYDHFNRGIFRLAQQHPHVTYILDSGIVKFPEDCRVFRLNRTVPFEDGYLKVVGCPSTDIGVSFYIEAEGKAFFHAGDFNCWHWKGEAPPEEERALRRMFADALKVVTRKCEQPLLAAFFPVDPRLKVDIFDGPLAFAEALRPRYMIPMHMQGEFGLGEELARLMPDYTEVLTYSRRGEDIEVGE